MVRQMSTKFPQKWGGLEGSLFLSGGEGLGRIGLSITALSGEICLA